MEIVEATESAKLPNVQHPTVPSAAYRSKSSGKREKEKERATKKREERKVGWRAVRYEAVSRSYACAENIDPRSDSRSAATEVYARFYVCHDYCPLNYLAHVVRVLLSLPGTPSPIDVYMYTYTCTCIHAYNVRV